MSTQHLRVVVIIISLAALQGCNTGGTRPYNVLPDQPIQCAGTARVTLGMSRNDLLAHCGKPLKLNTDVGRWGVHEQFVYGWGLLDTPPTDYVYVEDGVVTAFQW